MNAYKVSSNHFVITQKKTRLQGKRIIFNKQPHYCVIKIKLDYYDESIDWPTKLQIVCGNM